jgi:hypothetical protein
VLFRTLDAYNGAGDDVTSAGDCQSVNSWPRSDCTRIHATCLIQHVGVHAFCFIFFRIRHSLEGSRLASAARAGDGRTAVLPTTQAAGSASDYHRNKPRVRSQPQSCNTEPDLFVHASAASAIFQY